MIGRMQGVTLGLIQEVLAEARSGRRDVWNSLVLPTLREEGISPEEIERRFDAATEESRNYAFALADEVRRNEELATDETDLTPKQALLLTSL